MTNYPLPTTCPYLNCAIHHPTPDAARSETQPAATSGQSIQGREMTRPWVSHRDRYTD